jgi:hypothetical protein
MASINSDSYSEQELLEQFKGAINLIEDPISNIRIITKNTAISDDDYKSMMKFLSKELNVRVVFLHLYDGGLCWVFEGEFKGAVFDIVIGFGLD